ncbi:MAG: lysine--tRNA ligase [Anaerolineae bacterium]|nr:lysine--tRNA ligase [Anaerolineae bacterium]
MDEVLSEQEQVRREKLARLRQAGIDPYPARSQRSHTIAQARQLFERGELAGDTVLALVGRLRTVRVMGKSSFAHIEDGSGRVQIYLRHEEVGPQAYELFTDWLDIGDFVGVQGTMFRTRTGEVTLRVQKLTVLSKALHPLPDKWHGLKDVETRYRQRYLDLIANPEVREIFVTRARIVRALRGYLDSQGFLEVETPILQPIYGGAAARPFITHHHQLHQDLYLRISDELYLKRLIIGGYERVYEIGRDFRNEGVSFKHNPEFTQLEFYEAYADYHDIMRRVEEMIAFVADEVLGRRQLVYQGHEIDLSPPWRRLPLRQAILEATGIDFQAYPDAPALAAVMRDRLGMQPDPRSNRGKLIDSLLGTHVEPNLIQPTFIVDYPREISPLAKASPDNPGLVERFEYFIGGMEMGNAFSELNDPLEQRERFLEQGRALEAGDEEAHPVDEDYVRALSHGMPPTGGFGTGIDRLTMLFTDKASIREVILFPHLRSRE